MKRRGAQYRAASARISTRSRPRGRDPARGDGPQRTDGAPLRPIYPGAAIAGAAVTVSAAPGDNTMIHVAVEHAGRATCWSWRRPAREDGYFGELLATSLMRAACAAWYRRGRARRAAAHRDAFPGVVEGGVGAGHGQRDAGLGQPAAGLRRRSSCSPATRSSPTTTAYWSCRAALAAAASAPAAREKEAAARSASPPASSASTSTACVQSSRNRGSSMSTSPAMRAPEEKRPMAIDPDRLKSQTRPHGLPFRISKIGHVVLQRQRPRALGALLHRGARLLGVRRLSAESMVPGGMVFMRCNADHHGVALVGGARSAERARRLHHLAFEVGTLDEVLRAARPAAQARRADRLRGPAPRRLPDRRRVPRSRRQQPGDLLGRRPGRQRRLRCARPRNGRGRTASRRPSPTRCADRIRPCKTQAFCGSEDPCLRLICGASR